MLEAVRACCRPLAALLHARCQTLGVGRLGPAEDEMRRSGCAASFRMQAAAHRRTAAMLARTDGG
eukprot:15434510-Alexandrium_andersonii.AAC.1